MATFEQHIEGLTKIDIESSGTTPTETELQGYLRDGVKDCINKIIKLNPSDAFKFAKESQATNDTGITVTGRILSIVRHHDSTTIVRPCTSMPAELRYESTDSASLHYRSKFNPGYYLLDGKVHVRPAAAGGNNDVNVSQVHYDTTVEPSNNYNAGAIDNFPIEYEHLVALYAAAMSCHSAAGDMQNNLPTKPTIPDVPNFNHPDVEIPSLPSYFVEDPKFNFTDVKTAIQREDFDLVDKLINLHEKEKDEYDKTMENETKQFEKEMEVFKSSLDKVIKDGDRDAQIEATEYRNEIFKYQYDTQEFQAEMQEKVAQYKWYFSQYTVFMNQYNEGIGSLTGQKPRKRKTALESDERPKQRTRQKQGDE